MAMSGPARCLGMFLADLGAEVIKVGAPHRLSGVSIGGQRAPVGSIGGDRGSTSPDDPRAFHGLDRGKKSIAIHLGDPRGRELYLKLIEQSDVVLENFSPRVMPSLGLSYDVLAEVNPLIIMVALSASGATEGPWRNLVTYGPSLAALYGLKSLLGYPDDPQPREDTADLDPTAAGHAFIALLAALEYRERTGRGQFIDLAQGEATLQRAAEPLMDWLLNRRDAGPRGNRGSAMAPHGVYPALEEDSWLAIVVRSDTEWSALCGIAPRLDQPQWATTRGRLNDQDALDAAVSSWTRNYDSMELSIQLQGAGVPAFPMMDPTALLIRRRLRCAVKRQHRPQRRGRRPRPRRRALHRHALEDGPHPGRAHRAHSQPRRARRRGLRRPARPRRSCASRTPRGRRDLTASGAAIL